MEEIKFAIVQRPRQISVRKPFYDAHELSDALAHLEAARKEAPPDVEIELVRVSYTRSPSGGISADSSVVHVESAPEGSTSDTLR